MIKFNKFKIGTRTVKTALGVTLAIMVAKYIGINNFISTGIIVVLCVQSTRKQSFIAAYTRFVACMLGMIMAGMMFELLGYHIYVIGLMLLLFIPLTVTLRVNAGVVTSIVIILHIFNAKHFTFDILINEFFVVIIGISISLLVNWYMPNPEEKLQHQVYLIEEQFKCIFQQLTDHLLHPEQQLVVQQQLADTFIIIKESIEMSRFDNENHFLNHHHYFDYFKMRESQICIIARIVTLVEDIKVYQLENEMIAPFIKCIAEEIHEKTTAQLRLYDLYTIKIKIDNLSLPLTHEQLITRTNMYQFIKEMEHYLKLKQKFGDVNVQHRGWVGNFI